MENCKQRILVQMHIFVIIKLRSVEVFVQPCMNIQKDKQ